MTADCPDCGETLQEERNQLTDDEYTEVLDCPECDFGLETMSNLAWRDRHSTAVGGGSA